LHAELDIAAGRLKKTIGIAGGVIKIVAGAGRTGTFLVVAVNEAVAVVVNAVVADFGNDIFGRRRNYFLGKHRYCSQQQPQQERAGYKVYTGGKEVLIGLHNWVGYVRWLIANVIPRRLVYKKV
jgi:hypothetical protein